MLPYFSMSSMMAACRVNIINAMSIEAIPCREACSAIFFNDKRKRSDFDNCTVILLHQTLLDIVLVSFV